MHFALCSALVVHEIAVVIGIMDGKKQVAIAITLNDRDVINVGTGIESACKIQITHGKLPFDWHHFIAGRLLCKGNLQLQYVPNQRYKLPF